MQLRSIWVRAVFVFGLVSCISMPQVAFMEDVQSDSITSAPRVAPGGSVPVRTRLANFGTDSRADVTIHYSVLTSGGEVLATETETLAVHTSASFIHNFLLPSGILPGSYKMLVSVSYGGQVAPAVSSFQFVVESSIFGVFLSDLFLYVMIALCSVVLVLAAIWFFEWRHHNSKRVHTYDHFPAQLRVYYEMVGGVIQEMRLHEGDRALTMASTISGLTINPVTGEVVNITGDPAVLIATLIGEYEKRFGKRVNLALGKGTSGFSIINPNS